MNIFDSLNKYIYNKYSGKLVHDENKNSFLVIDGDLIPIDLHPVESFIRKHVMNLNYDYGYDLPKSKEYQIYSRTYLHEDNGKKRKIKKFGFIDNKGNAFTPAIFSDVSPFKNGEASVEMNNNLMGRIDFRGNPIVKNKHLKFCSFAQSRFEQFGLCYNEGKWGIINEFCYNIIPCIYDNVYLNFPSKPDITDRCDAIYLQNKGIWSTGIVHDFAVTNILEGLYEVDFKQLNFGYRYIILKRYENLTSHNIKYMLCNIGGEIILDGLYDQIKVYSPKYVAVMRDNNWSLIYISDKLNTTVIRSDIQKISYGLTIREEKTIEYVVLKCFGYYYCLLELDGCHCYEKYSLEDGEIYFDERWDSELNRPQINSFFAVKRAAHTDIIDFEGEIVSNRPLPNEYSLITTTCSEGTIGIKQRQSPFNSGVIDFNGCIIIDPKFVYVTSFINGTARAVSPYNTFIFNNKGKIITSYSHRSSDDYPMDNDWKNQISDAFDGQGDAYWNID